MSRIGRKPINIPNGVNVSFIDGVFLQKDQMENYRKL